MKALIAILTALSLEACVSQAAAPGSLATSTVADDQIAQLNAQLSQELAAWRAEAKFPGASFSYVLPDGRSSQVSVGFADLEAKVPMDAQKMLGGSTGKMVAAACALKLVEQGQIKLDEPVAKWFARDDWFARLPNHRDLTLRSLLNHTSGLPNYISSDEFFAAFQALDPDDYIKPVDLLKLVLDKTPNGAVGEKFVYAETNYILTGLIIERVTGRRYYDVAADLLSDVGLNDTLPADVRRIDGLAAGYMSTPNPYSLPRKIAQDGVLVYQPATEWTGGGFATTSHDLAQWLFAFHHGKVLSSALTEEARAGIPYTGDQNSLVPEIERYGLGVMIFKTQLGRAYGHTGIALGYRTWSQYYPSRDFSTALMVNTFDKAQLKPGFKNFLAAAEKIIAASIDQSIGLPTQQLQATAPTSDRVRR